MQLPIVTCPSLAIAFRQELLKKLNNFVHLNLCIALACGLLVFLTGIEGAKSVDVSIQACKHNAGYK